MLDSLIISSIMGIIGWILSIIIFLFFRLFLKFIQYIFWKELWLSFHKWHIFFFWWLSITNIFLFIILMDLSFNLRFIKSVCPNSLSINILDICQWWSLGILTIFPIINIIFFLKKYRNYWNRSNLDTFILFVSSIISFLLIFLGIAGGLGSM